MRFLILVMAVLASGPLAADTRVPTDPAEISLSFAPVVRDAAPAVVNIYAQRVVEQAVSPFSSDPFFGSLFKDFAATRPRVQNSLGSGVILGADGLVVSNYHVVEQAADIRVVLIDRREYRAIVILADEESDLAILALHDAKDMPVLPLRNSDEVEVGELVLAIGNPFGVGQTVSSGIISGLARSGVATGNARGYFIQTDAAINPGNSGGALVDINGRLVGVNTSILTRSGGSNGIGFAIPSNLVAQILAQARAGKGRFERPWAGITGQGVDASLAEGFGLRLPVGVVISELHPASPFLEAGLQPGDIVLRVDGQEVNSAPEMIYRMTVRGIGETAMVAYLRHGQEQMAEVALIAAPEFPPRDVVVFAEPSPFAGLVVANVNPALAADLNMPSEISGVVVLDIDPRLARVGLRVGDILHTINDTRITSPADVGTALNGGDRAMTITGQRGSKKFTLRFRV